MYKINSTAPDEAPYLQILTDIADPPKKLYFIGELPPERRKTVAIVGSRKPTAYGHEVAHRLSFELAKRGVIIVSGLALGIDGVAQKAALEAKGTTISVLAHGLDQIHPKTNQLLGESILEQGGALISEYEEGEPPYPSNFVARDRLVSGLADVLIVVEAAMKSGTRHTAGFALDQGREVFAVPGNITSPMSEGCNHLIRIGATPVVSIEDTVKHIIGGSNVQTAFPLGDTPDEQAILDLIIKGDRDGEELLQKSGLSASSFNQALTMLEVNGSVQALGANQWTIR
jgi:DNA processing protein